MKRPLTMFECRCTVAKTIQGLQPSSRRFIEKQRSFWLIPYPYKRSFVTWGEYYIGVHFWMRK